MDPRVIRCLRHGLLASTALAGFGALLNPGPAAAGQLPTGYATAYGAVGFLRSSGTLNINQGSQAAIVNYGSFSIGRHNSVHIHQPNAASVLLNRVTGSTSTVIAGRLSANGQVYLINPNGIAITKSGVVKVGGGFVASSLGMTDDEFKTARQHFAGSGGRVSNRGTITIGRGGYADLIGGKVMNGGTIAVPMGSVGLGSGQMATLDVSGDGFLQVALPSTAGGKGALITDSGRISGITVMVDAATARAAARNAVNIAGSIDSHTISGRSGAIQIGGGDGGAVAISGRLSVASRRGTGGSVTITGVQIALTHARVNARGAHGGGTVRVGGDLHGGGTLPHATTVTVDARSTIQADATRSGNGGSVVVWSDGATSFAGTISAKGGPLGGNGGTAEVSSAGTLGYTGTAVLTAPRGATGTLLLDPENVTISTGPDSNTSLSGGTYTPSGTSVISNTELDAQLANSNVTITTGAPGSAGSDAGNITVAAPVNWSSTSLLTLTAANAIAVNAPITIAGPGKLALNAATTTANVASAQPLLSFGNGANVSYTGTQGSGQALTINGTPYTLEYSLASLSGDVGGATNNGGSYALATSVDGSNGGSGYSGAVVPTLSGTLEGLGNTISGLTINAPSATNVGLIGTLNGGGTVRDIGLVGGTVSGTVNPVNVGELVGDNNGTIMQAYATGTVSGSNTNSYLLVGGLVGSNGGTITQAYATGAVSGSSTYSYVGGLVGANGSGATIAQAYATGAVSSGTGGFSNVGGLVGASGGTIKQAYATGAVSGGSYEGGLVGYNQSNGTITSAYYDTTTSGPMPGQGVGLNQGTGTVTGESTQELALALPAGFDTSVWANVRNQTTPYLIAVPGPVYAGADTTPVLYNLVFTPAQLQAIDANPTGNFALAQSIDATGVTGFTPIGESTAYTGTFNGLNNTISNLTISTSAEYAGLFGQVGSGGTVKNVGLVGGSVMDTTGYANVGELVGNNTGGTITQAYATGAVDAGNNAVAGGLVGYNIGGTITLSYATGAVGAGTQSFAGGLVGYNFNNSTIAQSYATGAATGATVGGLVGDNNESTIKQSYATGAASGSSGNVGGLVGFEYGGNITASAYDMVTTGQTLGVGGIFGGGGQPAGVTALTTAQLQSTATANPFLVAGSSAASTGFAGGAAGGEAGVYPYLTSFFPNGVQAVSGFAYKDAGLTPLASPASSNGLPATQRPGTVTVTAGTTTLATVTTGANGYYYTAVAAGTLPTSTQVAALTQADMGTNGSGAVNAVSFTSAPAGATTPSQASIAGLNVYGGYATYGSYSPSLAIAIADYPGALSEAGSANSTVDNLAQGLKPGYLALGPSFALDAQPAAGALVAGGTGFAITAPTTITGPLTLAAPSIAFDAPVTVNGGQLTLNTNAAGTLTFAAPLQYNPAGTGQSLTIEGNAYTLIYTEAQLLGLNGKGNGTYDALAASFTSTPPNGPAYTAAPIATYAGTLEGLGNTITGLTIYAPAGTLVGLVGTLGTGGTLRDIGLVGGAVQGGKFDIGMLVGLNAGAIDNAYATGNVNANQASNGGGLVGSSTGTIATSYATGSVDGFTNVGGLVGGNVGTIGASYATGMVSGINLVGGLVGFDNGGAIITSYATGGVGGLSEVGGLVGSATKDAISEVYATGSVTGTNEVGGLIGSLQGGTIAQGYASGAVSGGFGFVGLDGGTITASFYDMGTTTAGTSSGATSGVAGLSTGAARGGLVNYPGFTAGDWYQTADLRPILTGEAAPTVAGVTTIGNSHQLELAGQNLDGTYVLPQNVDVSDTAGSAAGAGVFSTNGFDPLGGNNGNAAFTGTFDGLGHTLTRLTVARPTENAGLFGISAGTIRYVGLVGGTVSGSVAGDLAGQNQGTILQSFATGAVQASRLGGGLVGEMSGSAASISESFATGTVTGNSSAAVGGFVGQLQGGTITASYAQGSVTQTAPDTVLGGFVAAVGDAAINQAYATGMVSGGPNSVVAGFAASVYDNHASITSAYFDSATTGQTKGVVYNNGGTVTVTALSSQAASGSTTDAYTNANYVGFDQTVWAPASGGTTNYYPQLYGVSGVVGVKDPDATSVYGTTPNVAATAPTYYGLGVYNTLTSPATVSTTANAQSDVGTYAITSTGAAATYTPGAVLMPGNTQLGPATRIVDLPGTLTITPATLTVSAVNGITKTYDGTNALPPGTVSYTVSGVAHNDAVGVAAASDAYDSPNAGPRTIDATGLTITGTKTQDYKLSATSVTSTGTINPAPLTVSGAKAYDGTTGFATGQLAVAGAVNGETITLTQGTGTSASADAGTYPGSTLSNLAISVSGGNAMASNYALPSTGTLVIGKAVITVVGATGIDKTYDATSALPNGATGFTYTGEANGDVTVTARGAMYDSPNAGQRSIDVVGLTLSGAAAGDYVLSSTSVTGSGTIFPAPVTIVADGGRSIYGNTPQDPGLSASGLQGGQGIGVLTGLSSSFALTDRSHAGSYTLTVQGTLTNGNYQVAVTQDGTFVVDQRALTILADNESRRVDEANPPLAYALGGMGLVNGDALTGALTTPATASSPRGAYPIDQGTLAASSDYAVTYVPGTLTIGGAPVVPTPVLPDISSADLASTADRAYLQVVGPPIDGLPFVFSEAAGEGPIGAQIVQGLTDPRFDQVIVCVKDICTLAAPKLKKPLQTSALETPR